MTKEAKRLWEAGKATGALLNRFLVIWLLALLLFASPPESYADSLSPGYKSVRYGIRITNIEEFPDYLFILYLKEPRTLAGWGGYVVLAKGRTYGKNWGSPYLHEPRIYAIRKSVFDATEISSVSQKAEEARVRSGRHTSDEDALQIASYFENNKNLIPSDIRIERIGGIPVLDPREQIIELFKIDSIRNGKVHISRVKTLFDVLWYPVLPFVAMSAILTILVFRKHRRIP